MNMKIRILHTNVRRTKYSSLVCALKTFIVLWVITNTIGAFANDAIHENFVSEKENKAVSIAVLSADTII
jgi:hypothetical protein